MAIKQKAGENFSHENIDKVLVMLEEGETKKACCDVLGMSYNTVRLNKILAEHSEKQELQEKIRKSLRNKPLEKTDIAYICQNYLNGDSFSMISDNTYRSTNVVKKVLKGYGIPLRDASNNYFKPVFIDSDPMDDYKTGDLVFSARYNSIAEIIKKIESGVYRICILGARQRYAVQPNYELADLRRVQVELGIEGKWETDTRKQAWASVVEANKKRKLKNV